MMRMHEQGGWLAGTTSRVFLVWFGVAYDVLLASEPFLITTHTHTERDTVSDSEMRM